MLQIFSRFTLKQWNKEFRYRPGEMSHSDANMRLHTTLIYISILQQAMKDAHTQRIRMIRSFTVRHSMMRKFLHRRFVMNVLCFLPIHLHTEIERNKIEDRFLFHSFLISYIISIWNMFFSVSSATALYIVYGTHQVQGQMNLNNNMKHLCARVSFRFEITKFG